MLKKFVELLSLFIIIIIIIIIVIIIIITLKGYDCDNSNPFLYFC
jgi:hypothetical protein